MIIQKKLHFQNEKWPISCHDIILNSSHFHGIKGPLLYLRYGDAIIVDINPRTSVDKAMEMDHIHFTTEDMPLQFTSHGYWHRAT